MLLLPKRCFDSFDRLLPQEADSSNASALPERRCQRSFTDRSLRDGAFTIHLIADLEKQVHDLPIQLCARDLFEYLDSFLLRQGTAVGAVGGERLIGIAHGDDTRADGDILTG